MPIPTKQEKIEKLERDLRNLEIRLELKDREIKALDSKKQSLVWEYDDTLFLIKSIKGQIKKLKK